MQEYGRKYQYFHSEWNTTLDLNSGALYLPMKDQPHARGKPALSLVDFGLFVLLTNTEANTLYSPFSWDIYRMDHQLPILDRATCRRGDGSHCAGD